jgi:hypothetical protein
VRQGFRLLFVIAAVPFVSGCFYYPGSFGASGSSSSSSSAAEASVRGAIPAIEAYYADNNTYSGATLEALQEYDHGVPDIRVVTAKDLTYCIESSVGSETYSKAGPSVEILPGPCPGDPPPPSPPSPQLTLPEPARALHGAVRMMFEFQAQHGTFEGITARDLEWSVPQLASVRVVEASKTSFCLETVVDGQTWIARQSGDVGVGAC